MNFGLTIDKLVLIALLAVIIVGPTRLPYYAEQLGRLVRNAREWSRGARDRLRDEMGPEFDDVDWKKLDPRQYDPRRIIRDALLDDDRPVVRPPRERVGAGRTGADQSTEVPRERRGR